jgi:hypothetical protein
MEFEIPDQGEQDDAFTSWLLEQARDGDIDFPPSGDIDRVEGGKGRLRQSLRVHSVERLNQSTNSFSIWGKFTVSEMVGKSAGSRMHPPEIITEPKTFKYDMTVEYRPEIKAHTEIYSG